MITKAFSDKSHINCHNIGYEKENVVNFVHHILFASEIVLRQFCGMSIKFNKFPIFKHFFQYTLIMTQFVSYLLHIICSPMRRINIINNIVLSLYCLTSEILFKRGE